MSDLNKYVNAIVSVHELGYNPFLIIGTHKIIIIR
jgi:hypothetical protein